MKDLYLKAWNLPNRIVLLGERGAKKFYDIKRSKKRLGIGLNIAEPASTKNEQSSRQDCRR